MSEVDVTRKSVIHSGVWSAVQTFGVQGVQFFVQLLLARLLVPADFGLIAMVTVVVQLASVFMRAGFGIGIIQRKELNQDDVSTAFWLNLLFGLIMYCVIFLVTPWVAAFYDEPRLVLLTQILALNLLFGAVNNVQLSLLQRRMQFKKSVGAMIPAVVLSGAIGVYVAYSGGGAWAIVSQMLAGSIINIMLLWKVSGWTPSFTFSRSAAQDLFRIGAHIVGIQFLDQLFRQLYTLVVGAIYSPALLGLYNRAEAFQQMPSTAVGSIVNRVALPVLARSQDDPSAVSRNLGYGMRVLVVVIAPMMIGLMITAKPLVLLLLTEAWLDVVPYFQLFCFFGLLLPVHELISQAMLAVGRSSELFRLKLLQRFIALIVLGATAFSGIESIILGQIAASFISLLISGYWSYRYLDYGLLRMGYDVCGPVSVAIVMALVVCLYRSYVTFPIVLDLLSSVVVGFAVYSIAIWPISRRYLRNESLGREE